MTRSRDRLRALLRQLFLLMFALVLSSGALADGNFYETLGVDPGATFAQIKSAWKKLVLQHHPDRFQGDAEAVRHGTQILALINAAEHVIGDQSLRAYYDYVSNRGRQHSRWQNLLVSSSLAALQRRFGPVEKLEGYWGETPAEKPADTKPQKEKEEKQPQNPERARETERKSFDKNAAIAKLFEATLPSSDWLRLFERYDRETAMENDPGRQLEVIRLLRHIPELWKHRKIADLIARKFEVTDTRVAEIFSKFVSSPNPKLQARILVLLRSTLQQGRTREVFGETEERGREFLTAVEARAAQIHDAATQARDRRALQLQAEIFVLIGHLASSDETVREKAFQNLSRYRKFDSTNLDLLARELSPRAEIFDRYGDSEDLKEIQMILRILENIEDRSAINERLRNFAAAIGHAELKALTLRLLRLRCEYIFE